MKKNPVGRQPGWRKKIIKSKNIQIRVTEEQFRQLHELCRISGKSITDFICEKIFKKAQINNKMY